MRYTEIKISVSVSELDELIEKLDMSGNTDYMVSDPRELDMFSEENVGVLWDYVDDQVYEDNKKASVTLYLEEGTEPDDGLSAVLSAYEHETCQIADDWMDNLQGYFVPTRYGKNVIAKPAWAEYEPQVDDIVIDIDPGQAFGTGSSPTTALALELLEKNMLPDTRVMDIGCGTAILGILAAKMGAREVLATDIDPLAVECSLRNVELNGCGDRVKVEQRNLLNGVDFTADIVVANLTVDILQRLFTDLHKNCAGHCKLVASGIIKEKEDIGAAAIEAAGFTIKERVHDGEWVAFSAER